MELYLLDALNRRQTVVDIFESMIWTERWQSSGDFELVIHSTQDTRGLFVSGTRFVINESYRVMEVQTVQDKYDADGKAVLTVKGISLEYILDDRVLKDGFSASNKWTMTEQPSIIARNIFHQACAIGNLDSDDALGITEGSHGIFPDDNIDPGDSETIEFPIMSAYSAIKQVCEIYDLGFRIVRNHNGQLFFDIYAGRDRTSAQSEDTAVIFSPDLENLQNTTELSTTALYKNVAYVFSPFGARVVYGDLVDPGIAGFERRVLLLEITDIEEGTTTSEANAIMDRRGREELAKSRALMVFDGEINQNGVYRYGIDYHLGDLVEMRNIDGVSNYMRVTEQIFISDAEGERSYPTLAVKKFIMPGTWLAWDFNQVWAEVDPDLDWADA